MSLEADRFRSAVRRFASGVTIVAVRYEGRSHGMTASSFASVSLSPPLILVCLEKSSQTRALVMDAGRFAVNILRGDQEDLARSFARSGDKPFELVSHEIRDGVPFLTDAIAVLACETKQVVEAGDHDVFIAEVLATRESLGQPLLYFDRAYRTWGPD